MSINVFFTQVSNESDSTEISAFELDRITKHLDKINHQLMFALIFQNLSIK